MNKRKIIVIAVILFLLVGLGTFSFAGSSKKDKETTDVPTEKTPEKEQENNGEDKEDNAIADSKTEQEAYNDAKKAVEKAEISLNSNDISKANDLVKELSKGKNKNSLINRIKNIQALIEATNLVEEVSSLLNNVTNKEEIDSLRSLMKEQKVVSKVNNLVNNSKKEKLKDSLSTINKIVNDTTSPIVKGLEKNYLNDDLSIAIEDENDVNILLNNESKSIDELNKVTAEGTYELLVIDKAFNETKITFVIDKSSPKITNIVNKTQYKGCVTPIIEDDNLDKITLNGKEYKKGTEVTEGSYTLVATDKAGNTTEVRFVVGKLATKIELANPENLVYDGNSKTVIAKLYDEFDNVLEDEITITYSKENTVNAGNYEAIATYAGNDDYKASTAKLDFTISKAVPTIKTTYTGTDWALAYGGTGRKYNTNVLGVNETDITSLVNIHEYYIDVTDENKEVKYAEPLDLIGKIIYKVEVEESENYLSAEYSEEYKIVPTFVGKNGNYKTLYDLIWYAEDGEEVVLQSDITMATYSVSFPANKEFTIDLNGHEIFLDKQKMQVYGGKLNLIGTGKISSNYNAGITIQVYGSTNPDALDYSVLNIGENVTIEGTVPLIIPPQNGTSYGVKINIDGTLNATTDSNGDSYYALYVNGSIKNTTNAPVININNTAKIISANMGIYSAGYANLNIDGAYIEGVGAGIGFKNGILNIDNNATIKATGENKIPAEGSSDGTDESGAALQIESHTSYGQMTINIKNGNLISENSAAIYEYIGKGNDTQVSSIIISGGTFTSGYNETIKASDEFANKNGKFITGGIYNNDPTPFVDTNLYDVVLKDGKYEVIKK